MLTLFQQHKRRLYTWTSSDGQHRNQIDYILCSQRWRSSIQSPKTRPGADCLPFTSLHFTAICKASPDSHFAFLCFFSIGMVLIPVSCTMSRTSIHSSSRTLSDLVPSVYFSLPLYNHKGFDLGHT